MTSVKKIKSVSLKKQCAGQKRSAIIFVKVGNILIFWIGLIKPQEKFGSGLQYSFHSSVIVRVV